MTEAANTVLVVDDDAGGRYLKSHVLKKAGYTVYAADTGRDALSCCSTRPIGLVLLDVRLPDINGIDVCRRIKAAHPGIAVLQTSAAVTSAHDRATALDGGADTFLVEPIEPEELLATAKALLRMRRAEQDVRRLNETLEQLVAARTRELTDTNHRLEEEIAQRRKAEDVLWHAQKLEAVGQLTGGIAHDFNNLLAVVMGTLEMFRAALESDGEVPRVRLLRLLSAADAASERGRKLTQQLLAFARRSTLRSEVATLTDLFTAGEPLLRRALGETITLQLSFPSDLWPCRLDPAQFEAAILNLLVNARDAMPNGGELQISAGNMVLRQSDPLLAQELPPGDYVCIQVTDSGVGMPPEIVAHIFEPFFTTKDVGKGTGLGLSQVYGFVKQSGGDIAIESTPGAGTTVRLYFPRVERTAAEKAQPALVGKPARTGSETVLVVEDDELVREMAVATLTELGYRVLAAENGPAALKVLRDEPAIDLLFSDVVMPGGMSGYDLIDRAREIRRDLKALITSGYTNLQPPGAEPPNVPLLSKPYHRSQLAERIRAALEKAG